MGCICSRDSSEPEDSSQKESTTGKDVNKSSVQLVAPSPSKGEDLLSEIKLSRQASKANGGSVHKTKANGGSVHKTKANGGSVHRAREDDESIKPAKAKADNSLAAGRKPDIFRLASLSKVAEAEYVMAGWPSWLASVAGEAIKGWVPRRIDSFEKLEKIGQGTYSSVYKARDLETGKTVALKKVRFVNMDRESVRFMAREIYILRKLDHPNVMKLEGLVTSKMSGSLHLVFEYMDHDLAGLAAAPGHKFSETQIKCYVQQLMQGLEHCHSRGILHRDIKGSNLLIDDNGVLKIGDFGLATCFQPDQKQPLTSRVVTLWYRAPELLLGATEYGPAIDLWSCGCIVAELFAGKPIMPGRTEVEQMHKIFKLCGSPSEEFWGRTKLPLSTSFKPQHRYKSCISETFKSFPPPALALVNKLLAIEPEHRGSAAEALRSEFFRTEPLPCDPSSLPKYPPSKEFDAKLRNEEERKRKAEAVKGHHPESVRRGLRDTKAAPTPEFNTQGDFTIKVHPIAKKMSMKYNPQEDGEPPRVAQSRYTHSTSMVHPTIASSWCKPTGASRNCADLRTQKSQMHQTVGDSATSSLTKEDVVCTKDSGMGYVQKKNRIHYSGPLVPAGGSIIEDMLKEHERQIQQAFRKAKTNKSYDEL
ncbi:probable serine/threonine-protein kinase At1g54610 [Cucurbita maxima]|uniref:Probable serine/threonine-protein kinase At1g54610 n=1 Tax=Cucurbita maxima TaxID=3661 RepID=A0A6J1I8M2_CUCMA|nr:probable serine/threonine-protein kinase At1g54610 [Cucurbita maxima]XP_022973433.1 probable serine/threonine-protein kinase At1g54610 [Cucurbita maxima]